MSANCTVPLWAEAIAVVVVVVAVAVVVAVVVVVITVKVGGQVPSPFAQRTKRRSEASQGNARQVKSGEARIAQLQLRLLLELPPLLSPTAALYFCPALVSLIEAL